MSKNITFNLGGMTFEYDEDKNKKNIEKHGISFRLAARVFFDYDRIEMYDEENSINEERYDTIGNIQIGSVGNDDILFVVYTERIKDDNEDITRIISARYATNFERGLYYGKN